MVGGIVQTKEKVHTKAIPWAACFPLKRIFPSGRQITTYRSKAKRARDQRATMPAVKDTASKSNRLTEKQTSSHTAVTEPFRSEGISGGHLVQSDTAQAGSTQQGAQDTSSQVLFHFSFELSSLTSLGNSWPHLTTYHIRNIFQQDRFSKDGQIMCVASIFH